MCLASSGNEVWASEESSEDGRTNIGECRGAANDEVAADGQGETIDDDKAVMYHRIEHLIHCGKVSSHVGSAAAQAPDRICVTCVDNIFCGGPMRPLATSAEGAIVEHPAASYSTPRIRIEQHLLHHRARAPAGWLRRRAFRNTIGDGRIAAERLTTETLFTDKLSQSRTSSIDPSPPMPRRMRGQCRLWFTHLGAAVPMILG